LESAFNPLIQALYHFLGQSLLKKTRFLNFGIPSPSNKPHPTEKGIPYLFLLPLEIKKFLK
jgi:hypothetical protein